MDWEWLMAQNDFDDGKYVRHIRLEKPFVMKCDGKKEMAVLYMEDCDKENTSGCTAEFEG